MEPTLSCQLPDGLENSVSGASVLPCPCPYGCSVKKAAHPAARSNLKGTPAKRQPYTGMRTGLLGTPGCHLSLLRRLLLGP